MQRPIIAFVAQYEPFPPPLIGGQLRIESLIRELLKSYRVVFGCVSTRPAAALKADWPLAAELEDVFTGAPDTAEPDAHPQWGGPTVIAKALIPSRIPAIYRYRWSSALVSDLKQSHQRTPVAAAWAYHGWMAEMARAAGLPNVIIDTDDFAGTMMRKRLRDEPFFNRWPLFWLQAKRLQTYERALPSRFGAVVVTKADDLALLGDRGNAQRHVVPNGTSIPERRSVQLERAPVLLFVGTLSYAPNSSGLAWLIREVLPRIVAHVPAARLVVAGRGPADESLRALAVANHVVLHESPQQIAPFYADATITVAPLFAGGGTSIKVLESLAFEVPVVATSIAVRGLRLTDGEHYALADNPADFATQCVRLLRDSGARRELAEAGRRRVEAEYSWEACGRQARAVVAATVARPEPLIAPR